MKTSGRYIYSFLIIFTKSYFILLKFMRPYHRTGFYLVTNKVWSLERKPKRYIRIKYSKGTCSTCFSMHIQRIKGISFGPIYLDGMSLVPRSFVLIYAQKIICYRYDVCPRSNIRRVSVQSP